MRRTILLVALGVAVLAVVVGTALATPPSGQTVTPLTKGTLGTFTAKGNGIKVKARKVRQTLRLQGLTLNPEALVAGTIFPGSLWLRSPLALWMYMT